MILVTGSTGRVGGEIVRQLAAMGAKVRAFVRGGPDDAKGLPAGVEIAYGDLDRPETIAPAMQGIEKMYLLVPGTPAMPKQEGAALEAAKRAGVKHIVKHSVMGAREPAIAIARLHRASETVIEQSGIAWTFVRPGSFMSNALDWAMPIKQQGGVFQPLGDGRVAMVDPRDIASVGVAALTKPGHEGRAYDVTGPEALDMNEHVAIISEAIGKPLKYVNIPEAATRDMMLNKVGMPAPVVEGLLEVFARIRDGKASHVSSDVETVTGKPARRFKEWVAENVGAFR
jgi:uncharacterized protein YbjT (DUF2867 family)